MQGAAKKQVDRKIAAPSVSAGVEVPFILKPVENSGSWMRQALQRRAFA